MIAHPWHSSKRCEGEERQSLGGGPLLPVCLAHHFSLQQIPHLASSPALATGSDNTVALSLSESSSPDLVSLIACMCASIALSPCQLRRRELLLERLRADGLPTADSFWSQ